MENPKLSGSLTITDGDQNAQIPVVPRPLLEALFATITSARDTLEQKRRLPSIVCIDDIEQLIVQLDQWSTPYDPISRSLRLSISTFSPDQIQVGVKRSDYRSLEEFKREVPGKTERVSSISVVFDFLARSEIENITNRCELSVVLKGSVRRIMFSVEETNQLGGRIFRGSDDWSAQISIRYSDVIVARGLLGVVDDWYRNLPQRKFP
jgi:hypothetical protein